MLSDCSSWQMIKCSKISLKESALFNKYDVVGIRFEMRRSQKSIKNKQKLFFNSKKTIRSLGSSLLINCL